MAKKEAKNGKAPGKGIVEEVVEARRKGEERTEREVFKAYRKRIKGIKDIPVSKIDENPLNWRKHSSHQRQALEAVLTQFGVAGASLVWEHQPGRYQLVDGHMRREELPKGGVTKVPCLVLDIKDQEEANGLLLSYDAITTMAGVDFTKVAGLIKNAVAGHDHVQELWGGLLEGWDREKSVGGEEPPEVPDGGVVPPSQVRMVQLFLTVSTLPGFQEDCDALAECLGTDNVTDTVLKAVRKLRKTLARGKAVANGKR